MSARGAQNEQAGAHLRVRQGERRCAYHKEAI